MNAQEARQLAKEQKLKGFDTILKQIEKTAKEGDTEMWYYNTLTEDHRTALKSLGYTVGLSEWDFREQVSMTKISW